MSKINRYNGNVKAFASESTGSERTIFGDLSQSNTLDANITADFFRGWGIVGVEDNPTKQDFNGLSFTLGQLISYLHQSGVPEWNTLQEYYEGSVVTTLYGIYKLKAGGDGTVDPDTDAGVNWEAAATRAEVENRVIRVTSIAAMEAYSAPVGYVFSLNAGGRSGVFDVVSGNFSSELTADTENGIYIGLSDNPAATSKVAKRRITNGVVHLAWFDPDVTGATEVQAVIQSAVNLTPDYGTLTYAGLQGTMLIDIPAVQSVPRRRGIYIDHPMTLKGSAGVTTKVKDFCSAWLTYTGVMHVYQAESSDVTIDGVFVDANADNHYETDGSGNLWWEAGPEGKRPPNGIAAYCPNGTPNLKNVVLENNEIYRPLGGLSANGSLGSDGPFALNNPSFLASNLLTNLVDGIVMRNNTVRRARGNGCNLSTGVINGEVYGNKFLNLMYHSARFYASTLNCHAYDNHTFTDYDDLATGYNSTDLYYWRTDLVGDEQYLIRRSGYRIGSEFTSTIDCSMTNNVIAYESNNPESSIIDVDSPDAASFQTNISAVKNVQIKNNKSYRSPFLGLFGIALASSDDGKDTEGVVFSGNEIYGCFRRQVLFQGNNYTAHDNYFEDCSAASIFGGIILLKGDKIRYFRNTHRYNINGGNSSNNVFEIRSTTADNENNMFVSDNLIEGYTGNNAVITDAGVFVHGSNIGIKPALQNGWTNQGDELTLYLNCAGQVSAVGYLNGGASTSDTVVSLPGGYGSKENSDGRGVALQIANIGDGTALAEVFPLRVTTGSLILDRRGMTASRIAFTFTYQADGRLF